MNFQTPGGPTKRKPFQSSFRIRDHQMDVDAIRKKAQADPRQFCEFVVRAVESGEFSWDKVQSLPNLFHALRDIPVTGYVDVVGRSAPISTSAFPLVTGALTVAGLNAAYEGVPTIGQDLVTDFDSNKRRVTIAGVLSQVPENTAVEEGALFPEIGAGEQRYDIGHNRHGFRASITSEMIEENDVAGLMERIQRSGEIPAELIEEQTLRRVTDHDGSASTGAEPYVLHISNAAQALYVTSNSTLTRLHASGNRVTNNALSTTANLDTVRARLAGMKNSRGKRIAIPMSEMQLLVPDNKLSTALKIQNSDLEPGVVNEANNWGTRGRFRPMLLSTPKLDDLSVDAWYLGNFRKQFRRKWKLRMELASRQGSDTDLFVQRRVALEFRVAWDVEVGAVDYVYVCQSLAASTAPKDE